MSAATTPIERSRRDIRGAVFYVLLLASIGLALLTLGVLVGDVLMDGAGWVTTTLLFDPPSVDPNIAGARPAILATIYLGILVLLFTVPLGVATALYLEEYAEQGPLVQPLPRGQHPEPRRRALDRLRHPRARVHRPRHRPRAGVAGRRDHPHAR